MMAERIDQVAATVRGYLRTDPAPWPISISAREQAQEQDFKALPFAHPMKHVQLAPLQYLGTAQDHLTAIAAVTRTPLTVMAHLTLMRTQIVATANAAYLANPQIDMRERVRRVLNDYLDSTTEQMRLIGCRAAEDKAEFNRLEQRRRDVVRGAKQLGWRATSPEAPQAQTLAKGLVDRRQAAP